MATTTLKAVILGDSAGAVKAFEETSLAADSSATKSTASMEGATTKIGGLFGKLGSVAESIVPGMGKPFDALGAKMEGASTKGTGALASLSTLGGASLLGLGGAFAATAAIGLKFADEFDQAESALDTSIKNAGGSVEKLKPQVEGSYSAMAKLGFNSTDTAGALQQLTTATGSPTKAIDMMGVAADLARMKHISLGAAAGILTKTLAGSTKALTAMGLNLDIGSGKLSAMHTASESLTGAQTALKEVQQKVADGSLKGVAAQQALENAQNKVSLASEKLTRDQQAGGDIMDAIKGKTQGAADAYGKTLSGEMQTADATVHNLATSFGEALVPKIQMALHAVSDIVGWFQKHKAVAEALAGVIGGVLAIAIGAFAINMGVKMVKSIQSAGEAMGKIPAKIADFIAGFGEAEVAEEEFGATSEAVGEESSMAFGPIGIAIMAIVFIGGLLITHWKEVKQVASEVWNAVKGAFDDFMGFVKQWGPLVIEAIMVPFTFGLSLILPEVIKHWGDIAAFFESIPGLVEGWFSDAISWLTNAGGDIISGLWTAIQAGWTSVANFFTGIGSLVAGWFKDAINWLKQAGTDIISGLWTAIQIEYVIPATWLAGMAVRVAGYFADAVSWLLKAGGDVISGLFNGITAGWTLVTNWLGGIFLRILGAIGDLGSVLLQAGKDVVSGLLKGLTSAWHTVTDFIGKAAGDIKGAFTKVLGILSPSTVFTGYGKNIMEGLANGIAGSASLATNAIAAVAGGVSSQPFGMPSLSVPGATGAGGMSAASAAGGSPVSGGKSAPVINITGVPITDATHIASEVGWALKTA